MAQKIPKRLKKSPLVEAVFELRFSLAKTGAEELLAGLLYSKFSDAQNVTTLPLASVPRDIREQNPILRYQASRQLVLKDSTISFGDRVASFSGNLPYGGWPKFHNGCKSFLTALSETSLLAATERYSLKFVNIIPPPPENLLQALNAKFEIGGFPASPQGFRLRTEIPSDDFINIIEIATGTTAQTPIGVRTGMLVSVDTIQMGDPQEIWKDADKRLDQIHDALKNFFFMLLTPETIESFEPEYGNELH